MKKKFLSLLIVFVLTMCFSATAMAAEPRTSNYRDVNTSGGTAGYTTIRFRCTCVQDSIPTNYSWASSITSPSNVSGLSFYQKGAITLSDHTQKTFSTNAATYSKTYQDALLGGYADMEAGSTAYGTARTTISVTR